MTPTEAAHLIAQAFEMDVKDVNPALAARIAARNDQRTPDFVLLLATLDALGVANELDVKRPNLDNQ